MPTREIVVIVVVFALAYYLGMRGVLNSFIPGVAG